MNKNTFVLLFITKTPMFALTAFNSPAKKSRQTAPWLFAIFYHILPLLEVAVEEIKNESIHPSMNAIKFIRTSLFCIK
jgi:hypothetical protein